MTCSFQMHFHDHVNCAVCMRIPFTSHAVSGPLSCSPLATEKGNTRSLLCEEGNTTPLSNKQFHVTQRARKPSLATAGLSGRRRGRTALTNPRRHVNGGECTFAMKPPSRRDVGMERASEQTRTRRPTSLSCTRVPRSGPRAPEGTRRVTFPKTKTRTSRCAGHASVLHAHTDPARPSTSAAQLRDCR